MEQPPDTTWARTAPVGQREPDSPLTARVWQAGAWLWRWELPVIAGDYYGTAMTRAGAIRQARRQADRVRAYTRPEEVDV